MVFARFFGGFSFIRSSFALASREHDMQPRAINVAAIASVANKNPGEKTHIRNWPLKVRTWLENLTVINRSYIQIKLL